MTIGSICVLYMEKLQGRQGREDGEDREGASTLSKATPKATKVKASRERQSANQIARRILACVGG